MTADIMQLQTEIEQLILEQQPPYSDTKLEAIMEQYNALRFKYRTKILHWNAMSPGAPAITGTLPEYINKRCSELNKNQAVFIYKGKLVSLVKKGAMGGKQKKFPDAGRYIDGNGLTIFVKGSPDYPADDIAEVVVSSLINDILPKNTQNHAARCEFMQSGNISYVASYAKPEFIELFDVKKLYQNGIREDKVELSFLGANPMIESNKQKLISFLLDKPTDSDVERAEKSRLRKELSELLVAAYLVGDNDVQPKNIGLYKAEDGKWHFCKIDHGWGLADMAKKSVVRKALTDKNLLWGNSATHRKSGIPTNHFNDYPAILSCSEFKQAVAEITSSSYIMNEKIINIALAKIDEQYKGKERQEKYKLLAEHMQLKLKDGTSVDIQLKKAMFNAIQQRTRNLRKEFKINKSSLGENTYINFGSKKYKAKMKLQGRGQVGFAGFFADVNAASYQILVKSDNVGTCLAEATAKTLPSKMLPKVLQGAVNFAELELVNNEAVSKQRKITAVTKGNKVLPLDEVIYKKKRNPKTLVSYEALYTRKIKKFLDNASSDIKWQFAAALYASTAAGDESLHIGQFMAEVDAGGNVVQITRIDFGARERFAIARDRADDLDPLRTSGYYMRSGQLGKDYIKYLLQDNEIKSKYLALWRQKPGLERIERETKANILTELQKLPIDKRIEAIQEMVENINKGVKLKDRFTVCDSQANIILPSELEMAELKLAVKMADLAVNRVKRMHERAKTYSCDGNAIRELNNLHKYGSVKRPMQYFNFRHGNIASSSFDLGGISNTSGLSENRVHQDRPQSSLT